MYIKKCLKQFSTQRFDMVQNVLITSSPKITQGGKYPNTLKPKNVAGSKCPITLILYTTMELQIEMRC